MKKIQKIFLILLLTVLIIFSLTNFVKAGINLNTYNPGPLDGSDTSRATDMAGKVLGAIRIIGSAVSLIVLAVIGIKYMLGSIDEKANYKENMKPYVIGVVLLMATSIIPSMVYEMFN